MKKFFKLLFVFIAVSVSFSYCDKPEAHTQVSARQAYKIAVDYGVPGHFVLSGKRYGYFYEIADAYAAQYPKDVVESSDAYFMGIESALHEGVIDMAIALTSRAQEMRGVQNEPLYTTSYVMLAKKSSSYATADTTSLNDFIRGAKITIPLHFADAESCRMFISEVPDSLLNVGAYDELELAARLSDGDFDLLVCEKNEAQVAMSIYRNLKQVYEFDDRLSVSIVMPTHRSMREFSDWFETFKRDERYANLNNYYFDKGVADELKTLKASSQKIVVGGISAYDNYFIEVAEREGVDWRLLSAIAYEESRFSIDACSEKGAVGIMQVMPSTAAGLGIDSLSLDLETNISVAARLIKKMSNVIRYDAGTDEEDKLKIMLAAYNCGVGRVMKAMEIVHQEGKGCCSWARVSNCLADMADYGFIVANNVKTGQFRRYRQTLNYVENVYMRYKIYCKALN